MGQQFDLGSAGWFFRWSHLGCLEVQLQPCSLGGLTHLVGAFYSCQLGQEPRAAVLGFSAGQLITRGWEQKPVPRIRTPMVPLSLLSITQSKHKVSLNPSAGKQSSLSVEETAKDLRPFKSTTASNCLTAEKEVTEYSDLSKVFFSS